jgi:predicted transcriptional regulator
MNSSLQKQAEAFAALSAIDQARLERLATRADVTPEALWPDVWLYGFEDTEDSVEANLAADEDIAAGRTVSSEEVMEGLKRILESHASRKQRFG